VNDDHTETPETPSAPAFRKKRSRDDEFQPSTLKGERLEEWMMTYMDTVTLLVTLFVLILSFASISNEKYNALINALRLDKHGAGILTGSIGIMEMPGVVNGIPPSISLERANENTNRANNITDRLQSMIAEKGLQDIIGIKFSEGLVDLHLQDSVLFPSGTAKLLGSGRDILQSILPLLSKGDYLISVQGHTDSIPISTEEFPSNWELSGMRAASVVRELIALGIAERRLELTGLAHTRPVDNNKTEDGRRNNRRVNILLHATSQDIEAILSN